MNLFFQLLLNGLVNGAMFAVLATSYGLIYRATRVFHVAYGAFFVLSAYILFRIDYHFPHLPIWLQVLMTIAASGVVGILMERCIYLPFFLKQRGNAAILVASLGMGTVVEHGLALAYGNDVQSSSKIWTTHFEFAGLRLTHMQIAEFVSCTALLALVLFLFRKTRAFKFVWAMGDDPELFAALGKPLQSYRLVAFAFGTAMAALPASLIFIDGGIQPHAGLHYLLIALVGMLVGGADRMDGWIVGGFTLAILQNIVVLFLPTQWMDLVTFSILIILMFRWPRGVLSFRRRVEQS